MAEWVHLEDMDHDKANHHSVRKATTAEISNLENNDVEEGDVIANTTLNKLLVNIGSSNVPFWTDDFLPVGVIRIWSGRYADIPSGWRRCDGASYNRINYPELSSIIGNKYDSGEQDTFKVPNLETGSIFPMGASDDDELGNTGGEETHQLTIDEMPSHSHFTAHRGSTLGVPTISSIRRTEQTSSVGGDQPHNNRPRYTGMIFIIKMERI